ncbi:hypothetical protein BW143_19030 [Bacillus swezeyi]|uniref:Transposase n=1 Tax=Bacillus swezeyi TaxID=1925020 RepID=A0A1R1QB49_9BACI|nr:hypothetical protein BW143_19030 [Bacillus swezeyi]
MGCFTLLSINQQRTFMYLTLTHHQKNSHHYFILNQKNGRKSHRYEKKTVFDILGAVYLYHKKVA